MSLLRLTIPVAVALTLGGCSISSLLGGGGKGPSSLMTLTPTAPEVTTLSRTASAGQAVTITDPTIDKDLRTVRVAVQVGQVVQYVPDLTMVDTPNRLFQQLVAETVRRTTNRVVLDPDQSSLDPGMRVTGKLQRFGYDASTGMVVVQYDGALSTDGGRQVETRRFTATAPADGTNSTVGYALNEAANKVAMDIAAWIGG